MSLKSHRSHRRPWWRFGSLRPLPGVLTAAELEAAFRQERARVDRNGRCFSVLVCAVTSRESDDRARTAAVLMSRMRSYDALGALDGDRFALLLPESDGRGAWSLADHARTQCAEAGLDVEWEVFTYPHTRGGRDGHGLRPEGVDAGPFGRADVDAPPGPRRAEPAAEAPSEPRSEPTHGSAAAPPLRGTEPAREATPRGTGTDGRALEPNSVPRAEARQRATPGVEADQRPVHDLYPHFLEDLPGWRRIADILVAGTLLLVALPLFLVVALAVKLTSKGPVFFVQWRAGRGGRPFRFYKFRSMYVDAEDRKAELATQNEHAVGPIFKIREDPRITPVGRWIRRASIDEMPQLWNVLVGDMTLVGPRPPTLDEVAAYERWQRERLDITGGLTCIWQVSGRSEIGFEDWVRMDLTYKRKRSAFFDVKLLWRTIGAVFSGRGAY